MADSLIPERPLVVSPSLAASVGLEQAILLQHLEMIGEFAVNNSNCQIKQGYQWNETTLSILVQQLPFWTQAAIRRILQNLLDLGMIMLEPMPKQENQSFSFAINQQRTQSSVRTPQSNLQSDVNLGAKKIPSNWQPDEALINTLLDKGIELAFIHSTVDEFVMYWHERNEVAHAWSSKFLQYASRCWTREQQLRQQSETLLTPEHQSSLSKTSTVTAAIAGTTPKTASVSMMAKHWQPNQDATEILLRMGIHHNFIDDSVPEFVLYWQERGEAQSTWNSKFVGHIKRQWARYTHTLKHDTEPKPIEKNWKPDNDVFDVLVIANIDADFARSLIPEFVLYWRDKNELHHSWNTRFLQYVKYQWSRSHTLNSQVLNNRSNEELANGTHQSGDSKRRTRDRSLLEDLTDRSWAS